MAYSVHNPEVEYCQVRHMIIYSFRKFNNLKLLRRPLRFSRFTDFPESGRKKAIKETLKIGKTQCLKIISKSLIFWKLRIKTNIQLSCLFTFMIITFILLFQNKVSCLFTFWVFVYIFQAISAVCLQLSNHCQLFFNFQNLCEKPSYWVEIEKWYFFWDFETLWKIGSLFFAVRKWGF